MILYIKNFTHIRLPLLRSTFQYFEGKFGSSKWLERNVAHRQAKVCVEESNDRTT